jgi:hypothetical protein
MPARMPWGTTGRTDARRRGWMITDPIDREQWQFFDWMRSIGKTKSERSEHGSSTGMARARILPEAVPRRQPPCSGN